MTDEQIEKGLECCGCMTKDGCCICPVQSKRDELFACTIELAENALAYINRLKEKCDMLKFCCDQRDDATKKINTLYGQLLIENNRQKDRIAELEKEIAVRDKALELSFENSCLMCALYTNKKCTKSAADCQMSPQNVINQAKQELAKGE